MVLALSLSSGWRGDVAAAVTMMPLPDGDDADDDDDNRRER